MTFPAEIAFLILAITLVVVLLIVRRSRGRGLRGAALSSLLATMVSVGGCYAAQMTMVAGFATT